MSPLCRSALLACFAALLAAFAFASHVEARQGFGGFFWSGPYYQPPSWRQRYYAPPRKRHYAPSRKRKVVRSERRRFSKSPKRRVALAVPNEGTGAAAAASVQISINKVSQKMTVTIDGVEKYVWLVSTGASGYSTPSGSYTPFRMEPDHYSKEWDDAPMPHSIFFTPAGHAIHGSPHTKRLGTPVSHGCVRLAPDNATKLYALVQKAGMKNTRVIVRGG